jgi:hypothetical protein
MAVDRVTITRNAASAPCGNALNDGWRCEFSGGTNSPLPTRINKLEDGIVLRCVWMPRCDWFERRGRATGPPLSASVPHLECQRLQRGRRSGRLRDRNVPVGCDSWARQPRVSRGRMAGRGIDCVVREAGSRHRDAANDDRVPQAHRRQ